MEKSGGSLLNWVWTRISFLPECVLLFCQRTGLFWQWNNVDSCDLKNGKNSWQEWRSVLVGSLHSVLHHVYWFSPSNRVVINVIYALTFSQFSTGIEKHCTDTYRWVYLSLDARKCRIEFKQPCSLEAGSTFQRVGKKKGILFCRHCCK